MTGKSSATPSESGAAVPGAREAFASWRTRARSRLAGIDLGRLWARVLGGVRARVPSIACGVAAAIPVIASTVRAVRAGWVPAGDDGVIATRGWDVFTSHSPLVGQYSEAGLVVHGQLMHSPGPLLYWLIALPARFGSVMSIAVTMGVVNSLAIVGCVVLARRRGGVVLMFATAVGIALMCQSLPSEAMHDIWNPAAGLFPFLLLVFVCWSLACGEYRLLPVTVLIASYVVQTHLMYAAPTAVLLAVGGGGLLLSGHERRRARPSPGGPDRSTQRIWPWTLTAFLVAVACWAAPTIDQIEHSPGNMAMIVRAAEHRGPALGGAVGRTAVIRSIGITPWWLYVPASEWERKADVRESPSTGARDSTIAILLALVLAGMIGAFVGRWDIAAAALIGLGLSAAIGLEAASNPSKPLFAGTLGYTLWWGSELGLWVWLIVAWAVWLGALAAFRRLVRFVTARWRARVPTPRSRLRIAGRVVAFVGPLAGTVAVGVAVAATERRDSHAYDYQPIRTIAARIERLVPPGQTLHLYTGGLNVATQPTEPAIRFFLVRHGDRVLANGSLPRLGPYYELYHRPVQWTVYLVDGTHPQPHMTLAARVRYTSPWGHETLTAWVQKVQ